MKAAKLWVHTLYSEYQTLPIFQVPHTEQGMCKAGIITVSVCACMHACARILRHISVKWVCAHLVSITSIMVKLKNMFQIQTSWLHHASNNVEHLLLPTDANNVKKHRVIKTF